MLPPNFSCAARESFKKHPDLREKFAEVTDDLRRDPFASHLKYRHLGGKLKDVQAVSITYEYRIILVSEKEVVVLDIESQDEVYW